MDPTKPYASKGLAWQRLVAADWLCVQQDPSMTPGYDYACKQENLGQMLDSQAEVTRLMEHVSVQRELISII